MFQPSAPIQHRLIDRARVARDRIPMATTPLCALAIGLVISTSLVAFEVTALITAIPAASNELNGDALYRATLAAHTLAKVFGLVATEEQIDMRSPRQSTLACILTLITGLLLASHRLPPNSFEGIRPYKQEGQNK